MLKRDLAGKRGDIAVRPRTEAEIRQVVAACASAGIPLTVRGSGTGNYGQSTPLHGGVILDLSGYNALSWVRGSAGRAQSGIRLADFDAQARLQGQELLAPQHVPQRHAGRAVWWRLWRRRLHQPRPAGRTWQRAGCARNDRGARAPDRRAARPGMLLHNTYGTNGIVLELEVSLTPAVEWTECIATFRAI